MHRSILVPWQVDSVLTFLNIHSEDFLTIWKGIDFLSLKRLLDYFRIHMYSYRIQKEEFMKPTTVRIDENVIGRLDTLAKTQDRPRSYLINQALKQYVEHEEWICQEVKAGLNEVERGEIATDSEVKAAFKNWGVDAS